jgi:hypothetical protein
MKPLDHLKDLLLKESKELWPHVPDYGRSINTFDKLKPEKREKKRIEKFLNLVGCYATVIENRGQRIDKRKQYTDVIGQRNIIGSVEWIGSGMRKGIADIKATIQGKSIDIELKRKYKKGKDRQSEFQEQEQERIEKAGGEYWIVESFEDFYQKYYDYIG